MNIQRCQPLEARRVFKLRPYINFGVGGGVFAIVFAGLAFSNVNLLLSLLVAGVLGFGLYYYLESRLLVITCPYCRKDINTNTPWQAGPDQNGDEFGCTARRRLRAQ